jgi:integrase
MPPRIKDATLDTRTARKKLARGKNHYVQLGQKLSLFYYRTKAVDGEGTWGIRVYDPFTTKYPHHKIAAADDIRDSDNRGVLNFWEACEAGRKKAIEVTAGYTTTRTYTVEDALRDVHTREGEKLEAKHYVAAKKQIAEFVVPVPGTERTVVLGKMPVVDLSTDLLNAYKAAFIKTAPRMRTPKGKPQRFFDLGTDAEAQRKRKVTFNRHRAILVRALNYAQQTKPTIITSDVAWKFWFAYPHVNQPRSAILQMPDVGPFIRCIAEVEFQWMAEAALHSGARYADLCRMRVRDYDGEKLWVTRHKVRKPGNTYLTEEGHAFFRARTQGRSPDAFMFLRRDGAPWGPTHQKDRMQWASEASGIKMTFHGLKHTHVSQNIMAGVPLHIIAENVGTSERTLRATYAHLLDGHIKEVIDTKAPRWGISSAVPETARGLTERGNRRRQIVVKKVPPSPQLIRQRLLQLRDGGVQAQSGVKLLAKAQAQEIVGCGKVAIGPLLEALQEGFPVRLIATLLDQVVADPPIGPRYPEDKMRAAWLEWGENQSYLGGGGVDREAFARRYQHPHTAAQVEQLKQLAKDTLREEDLEGGK